jgi:pimeloyl-ACP methyl ester carboxylesterase
LDVMILSILAASLALQSAPAGATASDLLRYSDWIYEASSTIPDVNERPVTFYVDRPEAGEQVPLLVVVDGSGCGGQLRPGWRTFYEPGPERAAPYARLRVEKPGVDPFRRTSTCTEDFMRHYTIDGRVLDHLRVLQHLRATADWWNGELWVWGWSDGGDVASQLVSYYPDVDRAVLGAMGGGFTMAEHFEDFWGCPESRVQGEDREACVADLRAQFQQMEDNPTWTETWSGADNSWRVWASRLRARLIHILADRTQPFLIVQGERDYDATPAESARALVRGLEAAGNEAFEYWEIACMEHGWRSLGDERAEALTDAMLNWLILGPDAVAAPDTVLGDGPHPGCPAD